MFHFPVRDTTVSTCQLQSIIMSYERWPLTSWTWDVITCILLDNCVKLLTVTLIKSWWFLSRHPWVPPRPEHANLCIDHQDSTSNQLLLHWMRFCIYRVPDVLLSECDKVLIWLVAATLEAPSNQNTENSFAVNHQSVEADCLKKQVHQWIWWRSVGWTIDYKLECRPAPKFYCLITFCT